MSELVNYQSLVTQWKKQKWNSPQILKQINTRVLSVLLKMHKVSHH